MEYECVDCEDGMCSYHQGWLDSLEHLLCLPVDDRMDLMGMERSGYSGHRRGGTWNDIGRVHDKNSIHMDGCIPLYVQKVT
jgi:hypothetical protein